VLESLLDLVSDDPALRASLPLGVDIGDAASVAPDVEATIAALLERLRTVTAADVADVLGSRLVGSSRPGPVAPLAQAAALQALTPDTVLMARPHQPHVLRSEGDQVLLRVFDRTVSLPVGTAKAVRALLEGERLRVGDLPDLDPDAAMDLARRLVEEAIAVTLVAPVDDRP